MCSKHIDLASVGIGSAPELVGDGKVQQLSTKKSKEKKSEEKKFVVELPTTNQEGSFSVS